MEKLDYPSYLQMVLDENTPEHQIKAYSIIVKGEGAFDWYLAPNPELVNIDGFESLENAMKIGNSLSRYRRKLKFNRRIRSGEDLPVIVTEGDSWFQFPIFIKETVDHLNDDFIVWSVGAAGDTVNNMIHGNLDDKETEYLTAIKSQLNNNIKAFLFSGAGNDIIGEDETTGESALFQIIEDYDADETDAEKCIDFNELNTRMARLKTAYNLLVTNIRAEQELKTLPLLFHGYDYVLPYPQGEDDPRNPIYVAEDEWLGNAFRRRNYPDSAGIRNDIIKVLIDRLYVMLNEVAGDSSLTHVHVIDCRGTLPDVGDWADEIHGTSDGFKKIAARFKQSIQQVT